MEEIDFSGWLPLTMKTHKRQSCYISEELKINTEWNLVCLFSKKHQMEPRFLEIRRNSTSKEILVSGTFQLMYNGHCVCRRKFVQLIEAGFAATLIELDSINYTLISNNRNYYITGSLKFPADESNEEYARGVQLKSLLNLSNDFECLLDPKATYFSDVNINCGSVTFSAHKSILSARSDVFAAMFATQMKENRNNKVDITDLSPAVLRTMLTYIYTGQTGDISMQSAGELLFAADKYQLQDLKRVCSDYLKSNASIENVLRSLVLGDLHDEGLKVFALDFICNSSEEFEVLEETEEWKTLLEENTALTVDVLTRLVKSKDQKLKRYCGDRMSCKELKPKTSPPERVVDVPEWVGT